VRDTVAIRYIHHQQWWWIGSLPSY
jgi:hypothetical protein